MSWEVREGDCVEQMRSMDEASVDAICTDPPYGLEFMGKEWDSLWRRARNGADVERDSPHGRASRTSPEYAAGLAAQEWHHAWATEALRVLKPGGHLLAFGGTRTYHRLACAVEDAGFEIRDSLIWLYGSGFPKSLDVSKAIDKAAGAERDGIAVGSDGARRKSRLMNPGGGPTEAVQTVSEPVTEEAQRWQGWGTALKPGHEPIVVARKPLSGTVAQTVLEHGTGALNVDGCRVGTGADKGEWPITDRRHADVAYTLSPTRTDQTVGRWPANVVLSHLPECEVVGERKVRPGNGSGRASKQSSGQMLPLRDGGDYESPGGGYVAEDGTETVTAYNCAPGCPVAELDAQSGEAGANSVGAALGCYDKNIWGGGQHSVPFDYADSGGASRFFYCAKASRSERNAGLSSRCSCETFTEWVNEDPEASTPADSATPPPRAITEPTLGGDSGSSTTGSGSRSTGRSPKASKSTTETATSKTIGSKTSNSSTPLRTSGSTRSTTAEPGTNGSDDALSADNGSQPTPSTTTSAAKAGSSTDAADPATSGSSSDPSSSAGNVCPSCGGVVRGANTHPTQTVKPINLMRWLCRLVCPPEGQILDPFVGSGTTGAAAVLEGFDFIGIEREAEYAEIAEARIGWWIEHAGREAEEVLAASARSEREREEHEVAGQLGLLGEAA